MGPRGRGWEHVTFSLWAESGSCCYSPERESPAGRVQESTTASAPAHAPPTTRRCRCSESGSSLLRRHSSGVSSHCPAGRRGLCSAVCTAWDNARRSLYPSSGRARLAESPDKGALSRLGTGSELGRGGNPDLESPDSEFPGWRKPEARSAESRWGRAPGPRCRLEEACGQGRPEG